MTDNQTTLSQLKKKISIFVKSRDWEQFHSPKNLSMSIAIEAAELMEHFQWECTGADKSKLKKSKVNIEHELADILAYILSFSSLYDIDLSRTLDRKIKLNSKKYPIKKSKGLAKKYTEL